MKSIYIIALTAILLSCSTSPKKESDFNHNSINFNINVTNKKSREITSSKIPLPENSYMGVYANYCPNQTWDDNSSIIYMNNIPVNSNGYAYKNTNDKYYWPYNGELQFFAFYPWCDQDSQYKVYESTYNDKNHHPEISYSLPLKNAEAVDLLMAKTEIITERMDKVPLHFNHLLSQVRFSIVKANQDDSHTETPSAIIIKHLELCNIYNSGKYLFDAISQKYEWKDLNELRTFTIFDGEKPLAATPEFYYTEEEFLTTIPQSLSDICIHIIYTIDNTEFSKIVKIIGDNTLDKWESGFRYTYSLKLYPTDARISFELEPAIWEEVSIDKTMSDNSISVNASSSTTRDLRISIDSLLAQHDEDDYYRKYRIYAVGWPNSSTLLIDNLSNLNLLTTNDELFIDLNTNITSSTSSFQIVNDSDPDKIKYPIGNSSGQWSITYLSDKGEDLYTNEISKKGYIKITRNK